MIRLSAKPPIPPPPCEPITEIQISRITSAEDPPAAFLRGRNRAVKLSLNAFRPQQTECTERFHTFGILVTCRKRSDRSAHRSGSARQPHQLF